MNLYKTQCCAIQEIGGLSYHADAEDAMIAFCKQVFVGKVKFGTANARSGTIYSFYLFTAAVGEHYRVSYGSNFEEFIKENGLGKVWASPKIKNLAFHSDHSNQVWIWMPDYKALKEWWEAKLEANKPKAKAKAKKVATSDDEMEVPF